MATRRISDQQVQTYLETLMQSGESGFVENVVEIAIGRYPQSRTPDVECLDVAEGFFSLYRRSGEEIHFTIGKLLRRSAHMVHRRLKKFHRKGGFDNRFLQMLSVERTIGKPEGSPGKPESPIGKLE